MRHLLKIKILICFLLLAWNASGQDANFTQFYVAPLQLNPALTGTTPQYRVGSIFRYQWPQLSASYQVNLMSFEYNFDDYDSGVGLLASQDRAGLPGLTSNHISAFYSYLVRINKKWVARGGIQAGFTSRNADFSKLVFEDQIRSGGATMEPISTSRVNFLDFGAGLLAYSEKFWFGLAAYHLNRPAQSFLSDKQRLNMRITVQAGAKFLPDKFEEDIYISPSLMYQMQGPFSQLDLGANLHYRPVIVGLWYRGLPLVQRVKGSLNQDAIAGLAGFKYNDFRITYSYDFNISSLNGSGGAHEISLIYEPKHDKRYKRSTKVIDCPAF